MVWPRGPVQWMFLVGPATQALQQAFKGLWCRMSDGLDSVTGADTRIEGGYQSWQHRKASVTRSRSCGRSPTSCDGLQAHRVSTESVAGHHRTTPRLTRPSRSHVRERQTHRTRHRQHERRKPPKRTSSTSLDYCSLPDSQEQSMSPTSLPLGWTDSVNVIVNSFHWPSASRCTV